MPTRTKETDLKFLQLLFQDHYRTHPNTVDLPNQLQMREFGMESWDHIWRCPEREVADPSGHKVKIGCGRTGRSFTKIQSCPNCGSKEVQTTNWSRHLGFRTADALRNELIASAPHSVYHSAAFYNTPVAKSMDEKGWQGAELVFDIDADHLDSPCSSIHDAWMCNNPECHEVGTGNSPETCPKCGGIRKWSCDKCHEEGKEAPPEMQCPKCGSERVSTQMWGFSTRKWICDKCLNDAKGYTLKLYEEFLVSDFGFDRGFIQLNYSGHRGYHVRVRDPRIYKLASDGRVEIVHYINGVGFNSEKFITQISMPLPSGEVSGWPRKITAAIVEFIRKIDSYTGKERWVGPLRKQRAAAIEGLLRTPPIMSGRVEGVGFKSWQEIAAQAVASYGGKIDVPVTHDVHRVIRLIGSLNGKTGFTVTPLTRDQIDDFDPFRNAIGFTEGSLKVKVSGGTAKVPSFRIGETEYGPYQDETVELPMAAAVFLLCKGVAMIE